MTTGAGRFSPLVFRSARLDFSRAYLAGVLNVTPDSFSDGGVLAGVEEAVAAGERLVADGADLVDVGGESTRPQGARPVGASEEIDRVVPVIERLAARVAAPISVDTTKAEVARAALAAGAEVVNDISGGLFDPAIVGVTADAGAVYVCGHVRGRTLAEVHAAQPPTFDELVTELSERLAALPLGLRHRTVIDPGLGFGKGTALNLEITKRAGELAAGLYCPVMVGPSRKRFLGELTGRPVGERDDATVGAALAAVAAGAQLVRVHDVRRARDALTVFEAALR